MHVPPLISHAGMNQRRPSATCANKKSARSGEKRFTMPVQLWFPPRVASVTSQRAEAKAPRRLHLHANERPAHVGDEVVVRAVPERDGHVRAGADEPLERR
jgi:hypothetical protein